MPSTLLGVDLPPEGTNVSKRNPLTISWTPDGAGGEIVIGFSSDGPNISIGCLVADSLGEFTLPATLVEQVPEVRIWILVGRIERTKVDDPALDIYVTAESAWTTNVNLVP